MHEFEGVGATKLASHWAPLPAVNLKNCLDKKIECELREIARRKVDHFAGKKEVSVRDGAVPSVEETFTALFQPDTLVQDEYFEVFRRERSLEPEKKLMSAVFEDAISCFQHYMFARDKKRAALFREAEDWILEKNDDGFFSFENICEILGIDPGYVRLGLLRWKEMKLEERLRSNVCLTSRRDGWSQCG